jgi:hypothetical protein
VAPAAKRGIIHHPRCVLDEQRVRAVRVALQERELLLVARAVVAAQQHGGADAVSHARGRPDSWTRS